MHGRDQHGHGHGQELPLVKTPPPGPRSRELAARLSAVECPAFDARRGAREEASGAAHAPIVYAEGTGSNVVDADGNRYVDLVAGFGALVLGHRPAAVAAAAAGQASKLWLALGDVYASDAKVLLCEKLAAMYPEPGARVMLGLSGADAVTAALKTAVLATGRAGVVAFRGAYHGLSHGPLAACGLSEAFREPFVEQLGQHVTFVRYGDADAAARALRGGGIGAVLVEPVLGRGGCVVPDAGFLPALRAACDAAGALLVADEIWTGLGRSGEMLASTRDTVPDVVCVGKALGGGFPVSACIGRGPAMAAWGAKGGSAIHTATHFGAPLACAAALATLGEIESRGLARRASEVGARWQDAIAVRTEGRGVREVRGRGLMVGVELEGGAARALSAARALLERGWIVLTGGESGDVLTLTPALDVAEPLLSAFAGALGDALSES